MKTRRKVASRRRKLLSCVCALPLLLGCGSSSSLQSAFSGGWKAEGAQASRLREGQEILRRLSTLPGTVRAGTVRASQVTPAAVGVTGRGLRGRALPGGTIWHYVGPVDVLPSLAGDAVAFSGEGVVTVLDVKTGTRRFRLPVRGRRLEGMAYDGKHFAFLLVDSDDARPDEISVVDAKGHVRYVASTVERLGTPHLQGGILLVPWNRQYVSAFDVESGVSLGRLLVRDSIHHVTAEGGSIWVLGSGASRIDQQLLETVGEHSLRLGLPVRLPGEPEWPIDASKPRPARAAPVALYALPSYDGKSRFFKDTYVYGYFEVLVGFDVKSHRVRWVNQVPHGVVGGAPSEDGLTLCLEDGTIWRAAWSDGRVERADALDTRLKACVVEPLSGKVKATKRPDLVGQVREAIASTGATMAAVHELLLADLARDDSTRITNALLAIAQDPTTTSGLAEKAAQYLASRRKGASAMIRALKEALPQVPSDGATDKEDDSVPDEPLAQSDDDLVLPTTQRRPPPVAALAEALTAIEAKNAAKTLARYLSVPALDGTESRAVLRALAVLGTEKQLPQVREFFLSHKNGGGDAALLEALELAAGLLMRLGTPDDRSLVLRAKEDVLTHPKVKEFLERIPEPAPDVPAPPAVPTSPP